jgi:acetolactate synthase I/II/III large subunit
MAAGQLASARHLILAGAPPPVSFFAYPGQPSELWPAGCDLQILAGPEHDVTGALETLAETVGPPGSSRGEGSPGRLASRTVPARPAGPLTSETLAAAIAA